MKFSQNFQKNSKNFQKKAKKAHFSCFVIGPTPFSKEKLPTKDEKDLELTKLKMELEMLKTQASDKKMIEKQLQSQMEIIQKQRQELEDLRSKLSKIDVNPLPQQLNVKSYLAGVQTNLSNLDKENAELEQEIQD